MPLRQSRRQSLGLQRGAARIAIFEWKGEMLSDTADMLEKEEIDRVYEELSGGKCIFELVTNKNRDQVIRDRLR